MRLCTIAMLLGLLTGCAYQSGAQEAYLSQFIGRPTVDLVAALGVPTRNYTTGGVNFLAYLDRRVDIIPGFGPGYGPPYGYYGGYGYGYGAFGGMPPQAVERVCETTFEVVDDKVRSFSLRGNDCR